MSGRVVPAPSALQRLATASAHATLGAICPGAKLGARVDGAKLGTRVDGAEMPAKLAPRQRRAQELGVRDASPKTC